MYFKDRREAGAKLAAELAHYRHENTAILVLTEGGVLVAEQIAKVLHSTISMLLTVPIELKDIGSQPLGVMDQEGIFTYNQMLPAGLMEEMLSEMRTVIESEKLQKFYGMSHALGEHGMVDRQRFYGHNVIVVADGLKNGLSFEAAVNFLKPIKTEKIIAAVPLVSVEAVDRLHILADEIHVLSVLPNYMETNHYFENNDIGNTNTVLDAINGAVHKWA